jgi:hypothetical protein
MPVTAGRLGYMFPLVLPLPKLARLWLLMGECPELVYDDTDAGVKAGVSMPDDGDARPGVRDALLMALL